MFAKEKGNRSFYLSLASRFSIRWELSAWNWSNGVEEYDLNRLENPPLCLINAFKCEPIAAKKSVLEFHNRAANPHSGRVHRLVSTHNYAPLQTLAIRSYSFVSTKFTFSVTIYYMLIYPPFKSPSGSILYTLTTVFPLN